MTDGPSTRTRRFGLIAAAAVAVAGAAAYAAFWKAGAATMRQTIANAKAERGPFVVTASSFQTEGFPFFLRGDLKGVSISAPGVDWRSDRLWVDALPINPARFVFTPSPNQSVDLGRFGLFAVTMDGGRASYSIQPAGRWVADGQADRASATDATGARRATASGVLFKAAPESDARHVSLFAGAFAWRDKDRSASGEKLLADFVVRPTPEGPSVVIRRFRLETSGATIECDGDLTLDVEGRPQGVLSAKLVNPKGFVTFLAGLGALKPEEAKGAQAALALAALAGGGVLTAPIELAAGDARIAGVKIATLPRFR